MTEEENYIYSLMTHIEILNKLSEKAQEQLIASSDKFEKTVENLNSDIKAIPQITETAIDTFLNKNLGLSMETFKNALESTNSAFRNDIKLTTESVEVSASQTRAVLRNLWIFPVIALGISLITIFGVFILGVKWVKEQKYELEYSNSMLQVAYNKELELLKVQILEAKEQLNQINDEINLKTKKR